MPPAFHPGVPLRHYRQHGAGVEAHCNRCALTKTFDLEKVIAGLKARGLGDESTGVRQVARTFSKPCERCGAKAWTTRPAWPALPGQDGTARR